MKKLALLFACFLLLSCHKDDDPVPTCGCDSPTINTMTNTTGVLKKNSGDFKNSSISGSYYLQTNNGDLQGTLILEICNENMLTGITVAENTEVSVNFSGETKTLCNPPATVGFSGYANIKLTQIQKQ